MYLPIYETTTPDEKKGLQLIALLSKENLSSKDHEEIQELLSLPHGSGINLNMRNRNRDNLPHQTALHMAVMNNHSQYVNALIEKGANVNVQDVYGKTPLHFTLMYFYEDSIKALLNAGADPMIKDIHGCSPDDHAKIKDLATLAHSTQVYNPNDVKKKLIQQSKNIQKAVAILNQKFINQQNA